MWPDRPSSEAQVLSLSNLPTDVSVEATASLVRAGHLFLRLFQLFEVDVERVHIADVSCQNFCCSVHNHPDEIVAAICRGYGNGTVAVYHICAVYGLFILAKPFTDVAKLADIVPALNVANPAP